MKQKDKPHMREIFVEAFRLMWAKKILWVFGFFALLITSSIGYQIIFQGIDSVQEPLQWWQRWSTWAEGTSPFDLFSGQWELLRSNPGSWFRVLFTWAVIGAFFLGIMSFCIYSITVLISMAKIVKLNGVDSVILAMKESSPVFWRVTGAVLLSLLAVNALILLFSIPVIALGLSTSIVQTGLLYLLFGLFLIVAFSLSSLAYYVILFIVVEQERLSNSILLAWALFKKYWVITLEMVLLQLIVGGAMIIVVLFGLSLLIIPLSILGIILVSQQLFDFTLYLPMVILVLAVVTTVFVTSAYSVFNLYSWTLLFMRFKEIHPKSRIAAWIELRLLSQGL